MKLGGIENELIQVCKDVSKNHRANPNNQFFY